MALKISEDEHLNGILLTGNFTADRDKALTWSGVDNGVDNRLQAEELRQQGYQTIDDTQGGKDLNQVIPYQAVLDGKISKEDYDQYWSEASNRFSTSQKGDITTRVNGALEDRDFRAVELPNFLADKKVSSVNGVPREELQEAYKNNQEATFNKVCEAQEPPKIEKNLAAGNEATNQPQIAPQTNEIQHQDETLDADKNKTPDKSLTQDGQVSVDQLNNQQAAQLKKEELTLEEQKAAAANFGATLYNKADMVSMQHDALRDINWHHEHVPDVKEPSLEERKEALEQKAEAFRDRQEELKNQIENAPDEKTRDRLTLEAKLENADFTRTYNKEQASILGQEDPQKNANDIIILKYGAQKADKEYKESEAEWNVRAVRDDDYKPRDEASEKKVDKYQEDEKKAWSELSDKAEKNEWSDTRIEKEAQKLQDGLDRKLAQDFGQQSGKNHGMGMGM